MTPDTFMDTFTLVRNSLEKQVTRFCEAFPTEKRVAIAFRISHQRCSMKKGLRPATFIKKEALAQMFSCVVSIIVYRNILSNFQEPQVEQPKPLLHLKKPLTVKFPMLSVQFGLLELISYNPMLF